MQRARSLDELAALPRGPVLVALRHAGSTSRLLSELIGEGSAEPAVSEQQALAAFARLGLAVRARGQAADPAPRLALAAATGKLLRALLESLQPLSSADFLLFALEPGAAPAPLQSTLLSVVVRFSGADEVALDRTLFALACQRSAPLELVVAAPSGAALLEVESALARHAPLQTFTGRALAADGAHFSAAAWAAGVTAAQGRYLAVLEAGDLVYPHHYPDLMTALAREDAGVALARGRSAQLGPAPDGTSFVSGKTDEAALDLGSLIRERKLTAAAALFDRQRLGAFALDRLDPTAKDPEGLLLLRLFALLAPAHSAAALPSFEHPARAWPAPARSAELPVLRSLGDLEQLLALAPAPPWLRYRVADAVNSAFRALSGLWRKR